VLVTVGYLLTCGVGGALVERLFRDGTGGHHPVGGFVQWAVWGLIMSPLLHPASPSGFEVAQGSKQVESEHGREQAAAGDRESATPDER
jgi:hypothetical protein